ncbi:MAG: DinB family protein [Pyrinomonadaceae bacterium]
MKTQTEKTDSAEKEIFVKIILDSWKMQNERVDKFLDEISDRQLNAEIADGKNTGVYLVGHLAAVNDNLFQILDLGERPHAELEEIFLRNSDNKDYKNISISDLKNYWKEINAKLTEKFAEFSAGNWFEKHASVSAEDFAVEPHRNKLSVLLSRTIHQANHLGQLSLLKK